MIPEMILPAETLAAADEATMPQPALSEDQFRSFYADNARAVQAYLIHMTGSPALAEDLLQEACLRFLRAPVASFDRDHQRAYFFRVAANLARDHFRGAKRMRPLEEAPALATEVSPEPAESAALRSDLKAVFARLTPRQRDALWLAYVEGASHDEIARAVGMKSQSIRPLLFRARAKVAGMLRRAGLAPAGSRR